MASRVLSYRRAVIALAALITLFLLLHKTRPKLSLSDSFRHPTDHLPASEPHTQTADPAPKHSSTSGTTSRFRTHHAQRPLTELSHKPLRAQLNYYFPYEPHLKFPAYIWQTWQTAPSDGAFPSAWRALEASWTDQHPGFIHEVITDAAAVHILRHLYSGIPDVIEAYELLPKPVLKADFFRYAILLARGGIYSDMDTAALKSAVEWVPRDVPRTAYGLVVGIEADPDRSDWEEWYSRRIQFCQWTIQAKPGHPVMREVVARVTEETLRRKREGRLKVYDSREVVDWTGPAVWTDILFAYFNDPYYFKLDNATKTAATVGVGQGTEVGGSTADGRMLQSNGTVSWRNFTKIKSQRLLGDVVVLPITCFSPGIGTMDAGGDDDAMAFVKHLFEGTWKPDEIRHIGDREREERLHGKKKEEPEAAG